MAVPFDPFSLEILPPIRPDTPKANLFVAGMLLNRISYHFVETALFVKNRFLEVESDFEMAIRQRLDGLEGWLEKFQKYDPRLEENLQIFFSKKDDLEERCEQLKRERKKCHKLLPKIPLPDYSEYQFHGGSGYPLSDAVVRLLKLCWDLLEKVKDKELKAGYLIDRFTHGIGNYTGEDYCYSHLPMVHEETVGSPGIVWRQIEVDHPSDWESHVSRKERSFLRRYRFDGKAHVAPYLFDGPDCPFPTPTEWANAVTGMWDALVRWDKPSAGFERLSVSSGDISLDGVVVVSLPPDGQLYQALKYMVDRLKDDPSATFSNDEVRKQVDSDDGSFSISKLIAPSKAGKNHRKLEEIIRPKVVVGDDGRDTVTLEKPPELKAFWRLTDPEIDRTLRPSQQKSR